MYINGIAGATVANVTNAGANAPSGAPLTLSGYPTSAGYLITGYIDDLRITKGVARYTANFTPPVAISVS